MSFSCKKGEFVSIQFSLTGQRISTLPARRLYRFRSNRPVSLSDQGCRETDACYLLGRNILKDVTKELENRSTFPEERFKTLNLASHILNNMQVRFIYCLEAKTQTGKKLFRKPS